MRKNHLLSIFSTVLLSVVLLSLGSCKMKESVEYNPKINPAEFSSRVNNRYFSLNPGTKFIYKNETEEGEERTEVTVTDAVKEVTGIRMTVVRDRVFLNDELIEDTRDWYAEDREGNVWYFGEDVDNYEDGVIKDHKGAWEAGVDGAKPGIIMLANPKIGDSYRQEYYAGKAEDMGKVVSIDASVSVSYGTFSGCLKTMDWNLVEPGVSEYKYYCPEVGFVVLEESASGGSEHVELTSVTRQ